MRRSQLDDGVYVAQGAVVQVCGDELGFLKTSAQESPKKRARLCTHPGSQDRLHEMFIVLERSSYVRPHRHAGKSESFHVIEGELDVFLFDEAGSIRDIIRMGDHASGKPFFYRLMENIYHTPVVNSPCALFHETTNGPFTRADTEFAPWAPEEENSSAASDYLISLRRLGREWVDV